VNASWQPPRTRRPWRRLGADHQGRRDLLRC
jgi:hypothetical protein